MKTRSFCLYCGNDSKKQNHSVCKEILKKWVSDMGRLGRVRAMQLAEHGQYGNVTAKPKKHKKQKRGKK